MAAQESAAGGGPQAMRMRYGADVDDSNFVVHGKAVPLLVGLLCALVFFVALCLYLRWRCARYTPADPEASSSSPGDAAPPLPGLHADAIRALPVTLYPASPPRKADDDDGDREALCSICIGALVAGEKVKVLPPCGHCFHPDCVDLWLRSHPSCPLCRCLLVVAAAKPEVNGTDEAV
ncbi:hypothetical protein PR202_gb01533 [Eleusine coracana subsp. coracana]|uniref:RING-type domain-containing protein n=1 Tax=Eleusine coracana subsp. coracana TaxID=191504 RepID=A0AAV5DWH9_ELECO|nr:hypothetical protein QOZ80_5BG0417440 [Eleusine coracana subsp. coracana]GJN14678.1 hypothetical protein PR202_gb01533 [Eleusine coracana subsp. coracana]